MKIIHCADLHLDSKMTANLTSEQARERQAELLNTFKKMIAYAKGMQVKAIIIAGDLYDKKSISRAARNTFYDAIVENSEIDFYYLQGNHDADSFLNSLEDVPQNLKIFSNEWKTYVVNENGKKNITITGVELNQENSNLIYSSLVLNTDLFNIVTLHGQDAEHIAKEKVEVIALSQLKNKGIDYLALGHVHAYKEGPLDRRGTYCYCGCLEGRGFDECGEHGFVLIDIDEETRNCTRTFIPAASRNLYTVEVDVSGCMTTSDISNRVRTTLDKRGIEKKHLVKIVLVGSVDVECEKNIHYLTKEFETRFYFLKIYDETKIKVDYQEFRLDESLKGEFVRTVMSTMDISEEEKGIIIRYGIQALAGEEME
ncbi:MAG TPA: metallophosphoesterase [Lachnospiraceae bacterium]|nr:metallophosphoesterase [Lachnospiraceae bacterium]